MSGSIGISFSHLIAGSTFGNRPIAVKVSTSSDPCPAAVKVGLGSTGAEPRCDANGRNRRFPADSSAIDERWDCPDPVFPRSPSAMANNGQRLDPRVRFNA
jgi:hypothetical protein